MQLLQIATFFSATTFHKSSKVPNFFAPTATLASSAQALRKSCCVIRAVRLEKHSVTVSIFFVN